jgi:isocitrate/isopropylmalate dehydrogenase
MANPSGMLLAAALMLEGLGARTAARMLENAVAETLGNGIPQARPRFLNP